MSNGLNAEGSEPNRFVAWIRSPIFWTLAAALALAGFLYYPFFFPEEIHDLAERGEEFFFEANEAAGAPVLAVITWERPRALEGRRA